MDKEDYEIAMNEKIEIKKPKSPLLPILFPGF